MDHHAIADFEVALLNRFVGARVGGLRVEQHFDRFSGRGGDGDGLLRNFRHRASHVLQSAVRQQRSSGVMASASSSTRLVMVFMFGMFMWFLSIQEFFFLLFFLQLVGTLRIQALHLVFFFGGD